MGSNVASRYGVNNRKHTRLATRFIKAAAPMASNSGAPERKPNDPSHPTTGRVSMLVIDLRAAPATRRPSSARRDEACDDLVSSPEWPPPGRSTGGHGRWSYLRLSYVAAVMAVNCEKRKPPSVYCTDAPGVRRRMAHESRWLAAEYRLVPIPGGTQM